MPSLLVGFAAAALPASVVLLRADDPSGASSPAENAAPPTPQISPAQLLAESRAVLARRHSITAKIRHHAELYGRDIRGNGCYMQGPASSRLMRYELNLQSGEREAHFLEVNDGRFLWRKTQTKAEPDVERIDVDALLAAMQSSGGVAAADPSLLLGVGGLGRLLAVLERDFDFAQSLPPTVLGGLPTYVVQGRWRPEALARYGATADALPPHVPDHVVIHFGCDDFFPYQIEYRRTTAGAGEGAGGSASRPLLKVELFEVGFDVPFDASLFHFAADHLRYVDVTERVIQEQAAAH